MTNASSSAIRDTRTASRTSSPSTLSRRSSTCVCSLSARAMASWRMAVPSSDSFSHCSQSVSGLDCLILPLLLRRATRYVPKTPIPAAATMPNA